MRQQRVHQTLCSKSARRGCSMERVELAESGARVYRGPRRYILCLEDRRGRVLDEGPCGSPSPLLVVTRRHHRIGTFVRLRSI